MFRKIYTPECGCGLGGDWATTGEDTKENATANQENIQGSQMISILSNQTGTGFKTLHYIHLIFFPILIILHGYFFYKGENRFHILKLGTGLPVKEGPVLLAP